jgi:hypothetical protein
LDSGASFGELFAFDDDGNVPLARVVFGPNGTLYGTTAFTYLNGYFGTIFNLRPSPTACKAALCPWTESLP